MVKYFNVSKVILRKYLIDLIFCVIDVGFFFYLLWGVFNSE